jgi:hypothetical protein
MTKLFPAKERKKEEKTKTQKFAPGVLYRLKPLGDWDYTLGCSEDRKKNIAIFPDEIIMFIEERGMSDYHFLRPDGTKVIIRVSINAETWDRAERVVLPE